MHENTLWYSSQKYERNGEAYSEAATTDILQSRCSNNFPNFQRKTSVWSLFLNIYLDSLVGSFQMFSCEYCDIFKNTFFYRTPPVAASAYSEASQTSNVKLLAKVIIIDRNLLNLLVKGEIWNSRVTKSRCKTELRKMASPFDLLTQIFL